MIPSKLALQLIAVTTALAASVGHAQLYNTNVLVNGDAELSLGASENTPTTPTAGWATSEGFTAVQYGSGGGFPTLLSPGPVSRGLNFFAGGPENDFSTATQTFSLAPYASALSLNPLSFILSGYLGGFSSQSDHATLEATFLNATSTVLAGASIGPTTEGEREGDTGLLFKTTNGLIPMGTSEVMFILTMTRLDGSYNDGYADNLSFVIGAPAVTPPSSAVPEPSTYGLFGAGAMAVAVWLRNRRRSQTQNV